MWLYSAKMTGPWTWAVLALLASCASAPPRSSDLRRLRPAPAAVNEFVRTAIADRYRAGDIPDQNLVQDNTVYVFVEMGKSGYILDQSAVPRLPNARAVLVDRTRARDLAYGAKSLSMIEVDDVRIDDNGAALRLGVAIYRDPTDNLIILCCCSAKAEFSRKGTGWQFLQWSGWICH